MSDNTDVGVKWLPFEEEANLLKKSFGWYKIGDTRLLWPYARTYDGLPVAIYIKKSLNYPLEEPIIYLIPLGRFKVKDHLKPKPECCFEDLPPIEEIRLIEFYLNRRVYARGICRVHIDRWDGKVINPLASAISIIETRFGIKNVKYI